MIMLLSFIFIILFKRKFLNLYRIIYLGLYDRKYTLLNATDFVKSKNNGYTILIYCLRIINVIIHTCG